MEPSQPLLEPGRQPLLEPGRQPLLEPGRKSYILANPRARRPLSLPGIQPRRRRPVKG